MPTRSPVEGRQDAVNIAAAAGRRCLPAAPRDCAEGDHLDALITLVIEFLFALVFASALWGAVRWHDPLARDVTFAFSGLTLLFVTELIRQTFGPPPGLLASAGVALLLAQPVFTLRLVEHIREVPRWLLPVATIAFAVTAAPLVLIGAGLPLAITLAAVTVFVVLEAVAAIYLGLEAAQRHGSARVRLATAAFATAAFALAILAAGGGGGAGSGGSVATVIARLVALVAALGYVIAFLPPAFLRRVWQATAGFGHTSDLFALPVTATPEAIWERFAAIVRTITGGAAYIVANPAATGGPIENVARDAVIGDDGYPPGALDLLVSASSDAPVRGEHGMDPIRSDLLARTGGQYVMVIPIPVAGSERAALVVVTRRASLFGADDVALLRALADRTAVLVDRRLVLGEEERLSARLAETVEALRTASEAKSDFLASMSHELRTPLNAIIGFSELMREQAQEGISGEFTAPAEWVEHIHRSGQHLLSLINDVLDLSKVEAGRMELVLEAIDLGQAISESLAGLRPLADRKNLGMAANVEPLVLVADRGRLRQILYNLLSNAIKYTPEGGRVAVEARRDGEGVRISVVDNGIGIAADDQPLVFEEFRQVGDPLARQAGTGLGLALTRRLVEAHGGRIELESTPGAGSRFTVLLPGRTAAPRQHPDGTAVSASATPDGPRGHDILVIEDDPGAVRLLRAHLEAAGYAVRVAVDGESGLAEAQRQPPGAIVLDVLLPTIDGWDVLRTLKADEILRDVPVVIVTVVDEREIGLALGATDYLLKPVSREALVARLERYTFTSKVRVRPVNVLAIDDDPGALDLLEDALVSEGFAVTRATSGRTALELAAQQTFDLVISDLLMPEMSGFEVVAALKAQDRTRNIPILVLTAHQLSEAEKARLNGYIMGVVQKGEGVVTDLRDWLARAVPLEGGLR